MASETRGPLLYAYRPIPANPMTVAVLLLGLVVTFVIGPIAAGPEGLWPLGGLCFVPVALVVAAMIVFKPSPTFVFENGIEISLPLWQRIRGARGYYAWSEIRDIYPRSYEIGGSFLSPFSSSAGAPLPTGNGLGNKTGGDPFFFLFPRFVSAFPAGAHRDLGAVAGPLDPCPH